MGIRNTRTQKKTPPEPVEEFSLHTPEHEPTQIPILKCKGTIKIIVSLWVDNRGQIEYFIFDFKLAESDTSIARIDPCHGTIHQHYLNDRGETVGPIVTIAPYTESNWQVVLNSKYDDLYDEYIQSEVFALKALEKWRKNGKQ